MRVLFTSHQFLPGHPAGTELYTAALARSLRGRGHDVRVFTAEKDISRPDRTLTEREHEGIPVYELVNNLAYERFGETYDFEPAERAFADVLDRFRPDVVHVMHLMYLSAGCVEEAARRGIPVFYTLHDYWLSCARLGQRRHADGALCATVDLARCGSCLASYKWSQSPLERRAARAVAGLRRATGVDVGPLARKVGARAVKGPSRVLAPEDPESQRMAGEAAARERELRARVVPNVAKFFAPSRFLADRMREWGLPADRIERLAYGVDLAPFQAFERRESALVRVAFLGTLVPHKGAHVLLEAWAMLPAELRRRGVLTLYGPLRHAPAYTESLARRAGEVGATLAGTVAREDLARTLADVDVLVVPSLWWENAPFVILEALATSTPLLVSDLGGMAELVAEGAGGWRFATGNADALAAHLARILADPSVLSRLGPPREPVKSLDEAGAELEARYLRAVR